MRKTIPLIMLIFGATTSIMGPVSAHEIDHGLLNKRLFTKVYERNSWGCPESLSGWGSTCHKTQKIRAQLPQLIRNFNIKTILDAPCGDFNWMQHLDLSDITLYIGLDIVDTIIVENNQKYGTSWRLFFGADIVTTPLAKMDLMICRDCMQHLPDCNVFALLNNIKQSGITYLLASNYPECAENEDLIDSLYATTRITYRNLMLPPFNLPKPLCVIDEDFDKKVLCLWKVADLPSY